jgi:hypothetical protein
VKGISQHPGTDAVAYVQAEGDNWWAERIHLLNQPFTVHLPGERLYKAAGGPGPRSGAQSP